MPPKKPQPDICTVTFTRLWLDGTPTRIISETLGISADRCDHTRKKLGLPPRKSWHNASRTRRVAYIPTEEEIRAKCLMFQSQWTDEERERRRVGGGGPDAVEIRIVSSGFVGHSLRGGGGDEMTIEDLADTSGQ